MKNPMKKSEILESLKKEYPNTGFISISYEGSGDSFNDFYDYNAYAKSSLKNPKLLDSFSENGRPRSKDIEKIGDDIHNNKSILDNCIWSVLESHDEVNFNNDGCEGEITFDLDNDKIIVYNRYRVTETVDSPDYEYKAGDLE
jgi:hypothetical protein